MPNQLSDTRLLGKDVVLLVDDDYQDASYQSIVEGIEDDYACATWSVGNTYEAERALEHLLSRTREHSGVLVIVLDLMLGHNSDDVQQGLRLLRDWTRQLEGCGTRWGYVPQIVVYTNVAENRLSTSDRAAAYKVLSKTGGTPELHETIGFLLGKKKRVLENLPARVVLIDEIKKSCELQIGLGDEWYLSRSYAAEMLPATMRIEGSDVQVLAELEMKRGQAGIQIRLLPPSDDGPLSDAELRQLVRDLGSAE